MSQRVLYDWYRCWLSNNGIFCYERFIRMPVDMEEEEFGDLVRSSYGKLLGSKGIRSVNYEKVKNIPRKKLEYMIKDREVAMSRIGKELKELRVMRNE